jgi:putative peptidoglycan lipid II flippase
MPHGGLALANSLATALETVGLLYFMRRRLGGLELKVIGTGVLKAGVATVAMSLALWAWLQLTAGRSTVLVALGGLAVGVLVYFIAVVLLKVPELSLIRSLLNRFLPQRESHD